MANNPRISTTIYKTNDQQLEIMKNGGTITKGDNTFTADENTIYLTPKKPTVVAGSSAPTTSTVADFVGQFYLDTTTTKLYQCTAIVSGTPNTYTWIQQSGDQKYLHTIKFSCPNVTNCYLTAQFITQRSTSYTTINDLNTDVRMLYTEYSDIPVTVSTFPLPRINNSTTSTRLYTGILLQGSPTPSLYFVNRNLVFQSSTLTIDGVNTNLLTGFTIADVAAVLIETSMMLNDTVIAL